jgi:outer membrane protein TolC
MLDAQRSLYASRIDLANAYAARQLGVVRPYQALGEAGTRGRARSP